MNTKKIALIFVIFLIACLGTGEVYGKEYIRKYEVKITNLTSGQIFSPPIVITHKPDFTLFNLGEMASDELAALAEEGNTGPLANLVNDYSNTSYSVAGGPILPGDTAVIEVTAKPGAWTISLAGMLVTTNDAFFAVRSMVIPALGKKEITAEAYDAGTEYNSEDCTYIPGPPCNSHNSHDPTEAEGYVYIHSGIHGSGLDPEMVNPSQFDWRNPVALVTVRRIHN